MKQNAKIKVKATHRYNAPAEQVFDTLMDPVKASKFMFATLTGKMIVAEINPEVGGSFAFVDRRQDGDASHYGIYTALDRPRKIAFEFAVVKNAKESDLVTIDIESLNTGCQVTLTHEVKAEYAHLKDRIVEGWDGILDGLGAALRRR